MAIFDRETGKVVIRIVYDGPGSAGKTTNLVEICRFFTPRRRTELVSPEDIDGRTQWFDWVQVDGGLVAGHRLRCQIVTVPGQVILRKRRSALLRTADVVVLVCDSSPAGIEQLRPAFGRVRDFITATAGRDVPLVVQANKRDLEDALPIEEVAQRLGADPSTIEVIGARARDGVGVRETLALAIRAAANRTQQLILDQSIESLEGTAGDADGLLAELRCLDVDLGEAGEAFASLDEAEPLPPPPRAPAPEVTPAPEVAAPAPIELPPLPPVVAVSPYRAQIPSWWPFPPTGAQVTLGNIWPATGREILRRLEAAQPTPRLDLVAQIGTQDGSGKSSTVLYDAQGWCLKTSTLRRFESLDAARETLVRVARTKLALGALTLPETVLVVGTEAVDAHWVWTFAPWCKTLRAEMSEAESAGDDEALGRALAAFGTAVIDALLRSLRLDQHLDLHPSNFAQVGERIVYLDDEVGASTPMHVAHALLQRAEEYATRPAAIARYREALLSGLHQRLGDGEVERCGLAAGLRTATPRSAAARELREQLIAGTAVRAAGIERRDAITARIPTILDGPMPPPPAPAAPRTITGEDVIAAARARIAARKAARATAEPTNAARVDAAWEQPIAVATSRAIDPAVVVAPPAPASVEPQVLSAPAPVSATAEARAPGAVVEAARTTSARTVETVSATATAAPIEPPRVITVEVPGAIEPAMAAPAPTGGAIAAIEPATAAPAPTGEAIAAIEPATAAPASTGEAMVTPEPSANTAEPPSADTVESIADTWPSPPVAPANLPSGFIWPVVAGRELVRKLAELTPNPRAGSAYAYEVGDYVLSTSRERRFADVDDGRAELLRLARARVARGTALPTTVLVLAPDTSGATHWIWTLALAGTDECASS